MPTRHTTVLLARLKLLPGDLVYVLDEQPMWQTSEVCPQCDGAGEIEYRGQTWPCVAHCHDGHTREVVKALQVFEATVVSAFTREYSTGQTHPEETGTLRVFYRVHFLTGPSKSRHTTRESHNSCFYRTREDAEQWRVYYEDETDTLPEPTVESMDL